MTLQGHMENGHIILDESVDLPDGTKVRVEVLPSEAGKEIRGIPTLYERMKQFAGILEGLPEDAALNHDHYLYGTPKKS
jgi:hypothetical protein